MLNFKKVILHNFGSYGHAEVDLENKGICLVSGRNNYKKDNALSNGSGKSQIFNAICYVLTGETPQGLTTHLKRVDTEDEEMYVELVFSVGADEYIIRRGES